MLILTRRVGETVMIGNEVTVTVLGVKGNQVRIGVNAPKDVAVHREEIYERTWLRSEEHTSELKSRRDFVCRLLLEKKNKCMKSSRGESSYAHFPSRINFRICL